MLDLVTIESHAKVGADRPDAALLDLAAAGRAERVGRVAVDVVGSLQERGVLDRVFKNPDALNEDVAALMQPPLAAVDVGRTCSTRSSPTSPARARRSSSPRPRPSAILTRSDPPSTAHQRSQVNGASSRRSPSARRRRPSRSTSAAPAATASVSCSSSTSAPSRIADEGVHVLVRDDLRDRRMAEQPRVGGEADQRAEDARARPTDSSVKPAGSIDQGSPAATPSTSRITPALSISQVVAT